QCQRLGNKPLRRRLLTALDPFDPARCADIDSPRSVWRVQLEGRYDFWRDCILAAKSALSINTTDAMTKPRRASGGALGRAVPSHNRLRAEQLLPRGRNPQEPPILAIARRQH